MKRPGALVSGAALAGLLAMWMPATPQADTQARSPTRLIAIGDIHGAYPQFVSLLKTLGIVDDQIRWIAGRTTVIQTGDFTDRGVAVRATMDLLMALQQQAQAAGGRFVVLLGNHEMMNLARIPQDVSPAVYATFADARSEGRRAEAYRSFVELNRSRRTILGREPPGVLSERDWMEAHPLGLLEYREAFGPRGPYGRWIREMSVVTTVDDTLFVHGGLNPAFVERSIGAINRRARAEIQTLDRVWQQLVDRRVILPFFSFDEGLASARADLDFWVARAQGTAAAASPILDGDREYAAGLLELLRAGDWSTMHTDGPLWFRGFATWTAGEGRARVEELLKRYQVRRMVVGHTFSETFRILARFDARVLLIDTGMLTEVYKGGRPSALEIAGDRITAVYLDERVPLAGSATAPAAAAP